MQSSVFRSVMLALPLLLALSAQATTRIWYRLDGFAPGETTTGETVITNIANPGVMNGKCYSTKFSNKDGSSVYGTDSALMPRGSVGFNGQYGVYDPVADTWSPRYHAMHFGLDTCTSEQKYGDGSAITTSTGSNLKLQTITVEVIFRAVETFPTSWNFTPLAMLGGDGNVQEAWTLCFGWSGKLATRYMKASAQKQIVPGSAQTPGGWHHAALTVDANGMARLFYDYTQLGTESTGEMLKTFTGKTFSVASHPERDGRNFPGEIMDVRVSDVALTVDQFLRIKRKPRETPAGTVVYVPYEEAPTADAVFSSFLALGGDQLNATSHGAVRTYWTKSPSAAVPQFCLYEKPALATRFGLADTGALVPNVSSLKGELISGVTTNRVGITLDLSNSYLEKTNFTAECFFKTTRQIRADETWTLFRSPCAKLGLGNDHKILARGFKKYNTYADAVVDVRSTMNVDDQKWHHVAYAYCVTNGTFTLYVDGVKQGETKTALLDTTGTNLPSFGWQNGFGADQFFPGWIDEARVTLRTLGPDELMMADPAGRVGTLAQITFDAADAAVGPYPTFTPAGTCLARAGGAVPTFSDSVLPAIDLDGVTRLTTKENVKSLALAGGQVRFADMSTLRGHNDFTVEWFMKVASVDTSTSILRLNCTTSAYEGSVSDFDKAWQVYVYDSTHLRVAATAASGHKDTPNFTAFPSAVADNRWHHYAVTFATVKVNGTTKTEIRLYRDYVAYGMQQFTGVIYYKEDDGCTFTIGANGNMTGLVDEIRVTAGVLPVNSFMRKHPGGIVVLVR